MLIVFDADGTLVERESGEFLPGVLDRLAFVRRKMAHRVHFAIATNQGGVGLRYWMESGGFGEPGRYPTASGAARRYGRIARTIGGRLYMCYAYRSKSGRWSPTPPHTGYPERWDHRCRKPAPGLIEQAIRDHAAENTLFVGDRPEDQQAAANAGIQFSWAKDFFDW